MERLGIKPARSSPPQERRHHRAEHPKNKVGFQGLQQGRDPRQNPATRRATRFAIQSSRPANSMFHERIADYAGRRLGEARCGSKRVRPDERLDVLPHERYHKPLSPEGRIIPARVPDVLTDSLMPPPDEGTWGGSMDPALWELYESGSPVEEVSIILRMAKGTVPPAGVRVVSSFGNEIYTGRIVRGDIVAMRQAPGVLSLKAGKPVTLPSPFEFPTEPTSQTPSTKVTKADEAARDFPIRRPSARTDAAWWSACDWGFDFTHANSECRWDDAVTGPVGSARSDDPLAPAPFNHGRRHAPGNRRRTPAGGSAPHSISPSSGDPTNTGSHGTHVADILPVIAGNDRASVRTDPICVL